MNQDFNNTDKENEGLQDVWLTENLNITQIEPPLDFTKKVMEQIEVKSYPLNGSPIFWILSVIPGAILLWLILFTLVGLNSSYHFNLDFIPNISNLISFYQLSKYAIMITMAGLFFIGFDQFLSNRIAHRESFYNFLLI